MEFPSLAAGSLGSPPLPILHHGEDEENHDDDDDEENHDDNDDENDENVDNVETLLTTSMCLLAHFSSWS